MDSTAAKQVNDAVRALAMRHRAAAAGLLAPLGLHPGQEVLLLELHAHGERTQAQLAAASGCEPPTITGSVRKLESAGLLVRRPSPTDGRATIVELSDRGRSLMPALQAAWCELAERTLSGLSGDRDRATALLGEMATGLDPRA
ncbi:MarR family winged helix-turn-helix transcriptional regulator [Geodermatophilus maliterrae]|uniref:MarR family winged helix-turn-helix transcriptional regulator n=1 Tax=Geodermatophilus maliterrae TaxID=3162531 RepID=A0ABV3XFN2_9ACTN